MNTMRAVEFRGHPVRGRRVEMECSRFLELSDDPQGRITIFAVATDDLDGLCAELPAGSFKDRGKKDSRRQLASYLSGHNGLVTLRTPYTDAGQARRGIRALLDKLSVDGCKPVCLIGTSTTLFESMWTDAMPADMASSESATNLQFLLESCPPEAVPDTLREAFIGQSDDAEVVRRLVVLAAREDYPVLVQGPTGTGKEVVARQIHWLSSRRPLGFMAVNCGAIPEELLESELFGHMRGAFTGALSNKQGLWTLADHGTLFLDEVGELSLRHQVKVLRALEEGRYFAVGAQGYTESNARVIAATNRNLEQMVKAGQFREDLYYRLFTFRIRTPALRDHPQDIPAIADHFWKGITKDGYEPLPSAVARLLTTYRWPGNARELKAFLINLFLLMGGRRLDVRLVKSVMAERAKGLIKQLDLLYKLASRVASSAAELAAAESVAAVYDRRATGKLIKQLDEARRAAVEQLKHATYFHRQISWLQDRFPQSEMQPVPGLVKVVTRRDIEAADWSLTPGRYVGVAPAEVDDDFDFEQAITEIHEELAGLNAEAAELAATIQKNFEELGA